MATRRVTRRYYTPYKRTGPIRARRKGRVFRKGRDRTAGYYGRYTGGELKFFDTDIDDAVIATNTTIALNSVLTIPEGNGESERIGRKITIKKIGWRYDILLPTTAVAANTSDACRVILYLDKQCNGTAATGLGIFETDDFQSFNNLANSKRFRILYDKMHTFNCTGGSGRGSTDTLSFAEHRGDFTFFKDCNIEILYDNSATSGVITSMRSNNIGVMLVGKSGLCNFSSKMRIRYTDR